MADRPDLEECWDWFSRIRHTLGERCRMVGSARRALLAADDAGKAGIVRRIERLVAEIDRDAITADQLGAAFEDREAVAAAKRVSRKLDGLSSQLTGLLVRDGSCLRH